MRVHLPAPLQSLGSCNEGGTADIGTRTFHFGVMLAYKKGMFQCAMGLFGKWNQTYTCRVEGHQVMAISCSKGNFNLVRKKIKISEWVNSGRGCLEVVKSPSLKRLKAQMENAEQF